MRNMYVSSEANKNSNQLFLSSVSKSSAFHNTQPSKQCIVSKSHIDTPTEKFNFPKPNSNIRKHSLDKLNQSQSIYENFNFTPSMISGDKTLPVRKSRLFNRSSDASNTKSKTELKRDLSMPPISAKHAGVVENNIYSQYSVEQSHLKYSIDVDLNGEMNNFEDSCSYMYDSIITNESITPPPVHIISSTSNSEYANRKAIIRPLAFRPVQTDWVQANSDTSPTKPPVVLKSKPMQQRRASPPPVPPHASRMSTKTNLSRVQSAKSGDSSGYYSSRATGPLTGTVSSTDISPTFDESVSILDCFPTSDIYNNAGESTIGTENPGQQSERDASNSKFSIDSEIMSERQRGKLLEAALTNSNCKLLDAESHIAELKKRLSQRSVDLNKAMESLEIVKRNLEHQSQKSGHLERTIQSLKQISNDRSRDCEMRNQCTQTIQTNIEFSTTKLLEQFEEERKIWLEEKYKVLTYQKQIEINFHQLLIKSRKLESYVLKMKSQVKDGRIRTAHSATHSEEHDKSSVNSVDSSNRSYFTNISRIEVTEHQSSF